MSDKFGCVTFPMPIERQGPGVIEKMVSLSADAVAILEESMGNTDGESYSDVIIGMHDLIRSLIQERNDLKKMLDK